MTDKTEKMEGPRRSMQPSLPKRPSYEKAIEEIDKWANSSGLQKPN
ncbi:MAG TPA: hypothetical protein VKY22_28275 [Bradyrhizobium sp.]|nr:hypothetical protein [Bradyrhizobium sp.]